MNRSDEVIKIGKKLDKMISSKKIDESRALRLLEELNGRSMTFEVLQKTRIGQTVNTLRKMCRNGGSAYVSAKALIHGWKALVQGGVSRVERSQSSSTISSSSTSSRPEDADVLGVDDSSRTSRSSQNDSVTAQSSTNDRLSSPDTASMTSSGRNKTRQNKPPSTSARSTPDVDDPVRVKCRELLANALRIPSDIDDTADVQLLAAAIEDAIFAEFKDTGVKYKNRVRSRVANLKDPKNPRLRENVLVGALEPRRLATMTTEEMASEEMRKLRERLTKEAIEDSQLPQGGRAKSDLFLCSRCGQRDTTYNQVQLLCSDEPMTTFVVCNVCGKRWRFT